MNTFGPMGDSVNTFLQTYLGLKDRSRLINRQNAQDQRQAAMDALNQRSVESSLENQALQRALTQRQLEMAPRHEATNELENMLKLQGDQAYNNPRFAEVANVAGIPFEKKQLPLESRNITGSVQGPKFNDMVSSVLDSQKNEPVEAAKGSLSAGPMQSLEEIAGKMGVAPKTGIVLPEEVRLRSKLNQQKETQADFLTNLMGGKETAGLTDTPGNRVALSMIPGLSANEVFGTAGKGAAGEPIPVMRINPRTGKVEQIGEAPKGTHFVNEPAPKDPLVAELAAQRLADAKEKNAAPDVSGSVRTTISGKKYVDLGDYQTPTERIKAQKAAEAAGVPAVSKEVGASLAAADTAKQNLGAMLQVITSKLPKDAQGRVIAGPQNKLSQYFQTDSDLAAFNSWRAGAIQAVQALVERGMGFRLNQAEINLIMTNDMPQVTDTVGTAIGRVRNVMKLIENKENSALVRDRSTLNPNNQNKPKPNISSIEIIK